MTHESLARRLGVVLAAAGTTLAAMTLAAAIAAHDGRQQRMVERGPVAAADGRSPAVLWRGVRDTTGAGPHDVVYVEPLDAGAAPPPGLPRWPAPGEVFLSPALIRAAGNEQIQTRYGTFAGRIGDDGLASPAERLAYARAAAPPSGADRAEWLPVTGFGGPVVFGEGTDAGALWQQLLALVILVFCPALALLASTARRAVGSGLAVRLALLGVALGAAPAVVAATTTVTLPLTGYALNPADLRAGWPWAACAALVALASVTLANRRRSGAPDPERARADRPRWTPGLARYAAGLAAAAVAISGYLPHRAALIAFVAGAAGLCAALPAALPQRYRRWTASFLIGIGMLSLLQVWSSQISGPARTAAAIQRHTGDRLLMVSADNLQPERVRAFTDALPSGVAVLALSVPDDQEPATPQLTASCAAWGSLGVDCAAATLPDSGDERVTALRTWYGTATRIRVAEVTDPGPVPNALLVAADAAPGGYLSTIKQVAYHTLPLPEVGTVGEGWLLSAGDSTVTGDWLRLFTGLGFGYLVLAAVVSAGRPRRALLLPMTAATVLGGLVAAWLGQFLVPLCRESVLSWTAVGFATGAGWLLAAAAGLVIRLTEGAWQYRATSTG